MEEANSENIAVEVAVEVENVAFDRGFEILAKSRPHADVGDASPPLAIDESRGRVDAELWDHAIMRVKIRRRESDRMTAAVSTDYHAFDAVRAAQHTSREIDSAFGKKFADRRRTDPLAAENDLRNLVGNETKLGAHRSQEIDVPAAAFSECKALSEVHLFCLKPLVDDIAKKVLGRLRGKLFVERDHDGLLDAENLEICQPLIQRLQQRRCGFSMKNRSRMRIERYRRSNGIDDLRPLDDGLHYLLMAEMQAVKNAQRQNGGP
jgi:hypothetical protein